MNIFRKKKKDKKAANNFNDDSPAASPLSSSSNELTSVPSPESLPTDSAPSLSHSRPHTPDPGSSVGSHSSPNSSPNPSRPVSGAYFGVQLEDLLKRQNERGLVPFLVDQSVAYLLNNDGFLVEGIFHIPGDNGLVQKIKQMVDKGERFDFSTLKSICQGSAPGEDIRVAATLLWLFLRQLPEPILTYDAFNLLVESSQTGVISAIVSTLQELLPGFPPTNREIMRRVLPLLAKVISHSYINKMSASNISSIFAPCFLRPRVDSLGDEQARRNSHSAAQITQVLIEFHSEIFDNSPGAKDKNSAPASSLSPDPARRLVSPPPPESGFASPPQSPELLRQPKKDTTPQLNRWKYQTFTHSSTDKLRNSTTSLPITPIPQRAQTPPPSQPLPPSSQTLPPSSQPLQPSSQSLLPSSPSLLSQPLSSHLAPPPPTNYPSQATFPGTSAVPPSEHPPTSLAYPPTTARPSTTLPYPHTLPTLSSTRIQEIITSQETRFRDMLHILQATTIEIDKAIANNTSIGNQLASLDEALQHESEVLHNILEQEKEKAALYAM